MLRRSYFVWLVLMIILIIRIVSYHLGKTSLPDGTVVLVEGRVLNEPVLNLSSQRIDLDGYVFYLPVYPQVTYGDMIRVKGRVESDKLKDVELLDIRERKTMPFALRNRLLRFFQQSLPEEDVSLIAGMTIGSKEGISSRLWERLKSTGTAHVVVASGMNVSLVIGFIVNFMVLILPRRRALILAFIGVWLYTVVAGFDAPIIRAAIMGSIAFIAQEIGRVYYASRALLVAAILMLIVFPSWLEDLGFILSFVATGSLILFEARFDKLLRFIKYGFIRKDFSTTLSAQLGVAPILFMTFGKFNILSPIYNVLILWTVPIITITGMVGGIIGLMFEKLGQAVLLISYPLTQWFLLVVM